MDVPQAQPSPLVCPQCHQPVRPEFYFCPNCGKSLHEAPLSVSAGTQAWIYAFSFILPWIAYLAIGYWPAIKYMRSPDEKAKQVGIIAAVILGASTVITFWLGFIWIEQTIQQSVNSIGNIGAF